MGTSKQEMCDFTGLPRDGCIHCKGPRPKMPPKYELRPSSFKGNPIVEIFKDGGPIHPYDERFRFGIKKARLMLAALPIVQEFAANTHDDGTMTVAPLQIVRDEVMGRDLKVWVEMYPKFIHPTGMTIKRPWLRIETFLPGSGARIGLGVQKAKAICAVAQELRTWLTQVS